MVYWKEKEDFARHPKKFMPVSGDFTAMKKLALLIAILSLAAGLFQPAARAADKKAGGRPVAAGETPPGTALSTKLSITKHSIKLGSGILRYTATAGYMHTGTGDQKADIFFVSYVRDGVADRKHRPVTFVFNGGPGASSIWLHLGAIGPRRISKFFEGKPLSPPYSLVDNEYTWLDLTDLVFIDPVGSGYSHAATAKVKKDFYGMSADAGSIAEFIQRYVTKEERWLSPKFIAGESYGTVRAVLLADRLHEAYGMDVNALILISPVLNFQTFTFGEGNDLPYVLFLPSYAAAASYHKKTSLTLLPDIRSSLREVEDWALNDYIVALARGSAMTGKERQNVVKKLSAFMGLPEKYIENNNMRITSAHFINELLSDRNRFPGLLDSRYTGTKPAGDLFYDDPTMAGTLGFYVAAMNDYARRELDYKNDLPYEYLSKKANWSWDWGSAVRGYPDVSGRLGRLINRTHYLKVFIAAGYYDLDAPYFATVYTVTHLGLEPGLRDNVTLKFYGAGHQMYDDLPSLKKLRRDISAFITKVLAAGRKK
jgi:carboxypeptidase C (cathepsin A)